MTQLEFTDDGRGNYSLSDRTFEDCQFSDLEIDLRIGKAVVIRNCKFLNCVTSPGTCAIGTGASLDRVVFSNLDCGDALRINSAAKLNEVVVVGTKPKALIVQPETESGFTIPEQEDLVYQLDVSEFVGEVSIVGIHSKMIRKDINRHVTIRASWNDEIDWKELEIGPFSYWRIFIKKLVAFNAEEGVFSIPCSSDKHYAETMHEKDRLKNAGISFE